MKQWLGSFVFTTTMFVSVIVYGIVVLTFRLFGYNALYAGVKLWCRAMLSLLRRLCGLTWSVSGLENLPDENTVILMKHSSSWETIAQFLLFPKQTWVLKRELIWAPILGWTIFLLKPISINRKGGRAAVEQVVKVGRRRLDDGFWVVVFPEGTRVPKGQTRRYGMSGTLLAQAAGRPVVPVAHNAGYFWPRRGLRKKPGNIEVVIGEPVETAGRDARQINDEVQRWIEDQIAGMKHDR